MSEPRATIVIPNQNKAAYIRKAVLSVLNQSYENIRVIVLDNASTDGSVEAISDLKSDKRLEIIENEKNIGPQGNFRKGEMLVKTEFFKFLCSDDYLHPDCVKETLEVFSENPRVGIIAFKQMFVDQNGTELGIGSHNWSGFSSYSGLDIIRIFIRSSNNFIGNPTNVIYRKSFYPVGNGGALYGKHYRVALDMATCIKILQVADLYCIDKALCYYRHYSDCYSSRPVAPIEWTIDHSDIIRSLLINGWEIEEEGDRIIAAYNAIRPIAIQLSRTEVLVERPDLAKRLSESMDFWIQGIDGGKLNENYRYGVIIEKAKDLEKRGKQVEALSIYKMILEVEPDNASLKEMIDNLGNSRILEKYDNEQKEINDTINKGKISIIGTEALIDEGRKLFANGDFNRALEVLRTAVKHDPSKSEAYNDISCILWRQGRNDEALKEIKKALEIKPFDCDIMWNYYNMMKSAGYWKETLERVKAYVEKNPDDVDMALEYKTMICEPG